MKVEAGGCQHRAGIIFSNASFSFGANKPPFREISRMSEAQEGSGVWCWMIDILDIECVSCMIPVVLTLGLCDCLHEGILCSREDMRSASKMHRQMAVKKKKRSPCCIFIKATL